MYNAFAFGYLEPYVMVLYSGLVDALDPEELKGVIGHEMGHIKLVRQGLRTFLSLDPELEVVGEAP